MLSRGGRNSFPLLLSGESNSFEERPRDDAEGEELIESRNERDNKVGVALK